MDDSTTVAVEGAYLAGTWTAPRVEGRRTAATAVDGRHRSAAGVGARVRESEPAAVRVGTAEWVYTAGGGKGSPSRGDQPDDGENFGDDGCRHQRGDSCIGECRTDHAVYDSGAQVKPSVRSHEIPQRQRHAEL